MLCDGGDVKRAISGQDDWMLLIIGCAVLHVSWACHTNKTFTDCGDDWPTSRCRCLPYHDLFQNEPVIPRVAPELEQIIIGCELFARHLPTFLGGTNAKAFARF